MKISCERSALLEAINGVSRAVSAKSTLAALEGILFKCREDGVLLTAFDLEIGIMTELEAEVEESGEIVLNARFLGDMVRRIESERVEIEAKSDFKTTVKGGITVFNFIGIPAADFPELPVPDTDNTLSIKASLLKELINKTIYAVSPSDQRPVHTGSKFIIEGDELTVVSVDGYRLAVARCRGASLMENKSFIVPGKTLSEIAKLAGDGENEVTVGTARRSAVFRLGSYTVVTRLLEGDFLDYRKAVPKGYTTKVKIGVKEFYDAIERVSLIITDRFKSPVRLIFGEGKLTITCVTGIASSYDEMDCEIEGEGIEMGFNNRYLLDALRNSGLEEVVLEISGASSPMKIVPPEGDDFLFLVLPVRIKNE
ncbi:MAG: DNA polymerase III subunit beta [Oscillospiraceae bacterium]|nr:DNA polymerase III subunit beta [Oscillospiraceae bacterium]